MLLHLFVYRWEHMYQGTQAEVRGQLSGVCSLTELGSLTY